jgi:hypothetical protein
LYTYYPSIIPTQLDDKSPPKVYVAMIPKKNIVKMNKINTSNIAGSELIIVLTSLGIPGTFFITFNGLKILKILTYYMP